MWVKETEDQCETELVFRAKGCEAHVQPAPGEEDSFGTEKLELSKNVCRSLFQNKWQIRRAHSEGGSMAPLLLGSIVEARPHQFELQDQGIPPGELSERSLRGSADILLRLCLVLSLRAN